MVVAEEGIFFLIHKVVPEITPKKTAQAIYKKLLVNLFLALCKMFEGDNHKSLYLAGR